MCPVLLLLPLHAVHLYVLIFPASFVEGTRTEIGGPEDTVRGTGHTFSLARTYVLSGKLYNSEVSSPWHVSVSCVFYRMFTLFPPTPTRKSWFLSESSVRTTDFNLPQSTDSGLNFLWLLLHPSVCKDQDCTGSWRCIAKGKSSKNPPPPPPPLPRAVSTSACVIFPAPRHRK